MSASTEGKIVQIEEWQPEHKQQFGKLLGQWIKKNRPSQTIFAREVGVAPQAISAYTLGANMPRREIRSRIAEAMGVTLKELDARILQAKVEQEKPLEEVLRAVRSMPLAEFLTLVQVVHDRELEVLRECVNPEKSKTIV